jgi:DNA polymerase (family 10)
MTGSAAEGEGNRPLENSEIAHILEQLGSLLEFKNENMFKVRSYRMAADAIRDWHASIAEIAARGGAAELRAIPGIGKTISSQIEEIIRTGTSPVFEALKQEIPETVLDLIKVSGIGLKTAQTLFRDFGIKSLGELRIFAEGGGLLSVPGLGEKTAARVLRSLNRIESEQQVIVQPG